METKERQNQINHLPTMEEVIVAVLAEHNIVGKAITSSAGWKIGFDCPKQKFIYELKGGNEYFTSIIIDRFIKDCNRSHGTPKEYF